MHTFPLESLLMLKTRVVAARAWIVPATMAPIYLLLLASGARAEGDQMPSEISRRPLPPAATGQAAAVVATGKDGSGRSPATSANNRSRMSEAGAGERDAEGSGTSAAGETGGSTVAPAPAPTPESKSSNPAAGQSAAAPADPIVAAIREKLSSNTF